MCPLGWFPCALTANLSHGNGFAGQLPDVTVCVAGSEGNKDSGKNVACSGKITMNEEKKV